MPEALPHYPDADERLVADLLLGEAGAAEQFYARIDPVIRTVTSRFFRHVDAEDAIQEVYAKLCARDWRVVKLYNRESPLKAYIAVVAKRVCIDIHRRKRKEPPMDADVPELADDDPAVDPEAVIYARQLRECLGRALAALSETSRRIIRLRHFEELSHAEIAARLDKTTGYVGPTLSRAERYLKDEVREHCADHLGPFATVLK